MCTYRHNACRLWKLDPTINHHYIFGNLLMMNTTWKMKNNNKNIFWSVINQIEIIKERLHHFQGVTLILPLTRYRSFYYTSSSSLRQIMNVGVYWDQRRDNLDKSGILNFISVSNLWSGTTIWWCAGKRRIFNSRLLMKKYLCKVLDVTF